MLVRVLAAEYLQEDRLRILRSNDGVQFVGKYDRAGELSISTVAVTEAKRSFPCNVSQKDVGLSKDRHGVEKVEGAWSGKVTLAYVPGEAAMLAPLDIDRNLRPWPSGMKDLPVPVSPDVGRGVSRVVAYP